MVIPIIKIQMKNIDSKPKITSEDNEDLGYQGPSYSELDDNFNIPEKFEKDEDLDLGSKVCVNDQEQGEEESTYSLKISTYKAFIHDLPKEQRDNEYILTGYRMHYKGFTNVFKTIFMCHNETFNIWSHGLGMLVFLVIAIVILSIYPNMERDGTFGSLQLFFTA